MEIKKEHDEKEEKKEKLRCNKGYPSNVNLTLGMGLSPLCIFSSRIPKKLFLTAFDAARTFDCVCLTSNPGMNIYNNMIYIMTFFIISFTSSNRILEIGITENLTLNHLFHNAELTLAKSTRQRKANCEIVRN